MASRYGTYLERLNRGYKVVDSGCWEWQGKLTEKGYARFLYEGVRTFAHRVSYFLFIGEIANKKLMVCHDCDNPSCVNPFHLFLGTAKDNDNDSRQKGRQPIAKHGSQAMYSNNGCRCNECMQAMRDYATKLREKNRDYLREYHREYRIKNAETLKAKQAEYSERNKYYRKIKSAENYQKRKEKLGIGDKRVATHGTNYMYSVKGCRCDACKKAGSEYSKKRLSNPIAYALRKETLRKYEEKQKALKLAQKNIS